MNCWQKFANKQVWLFKKDFMINFNENVNEK